MLAWKKIVNWKRKDRYVSKKWRSGLEWIRGDPDEQIWVWWADPLKKRLTGKYLIVRDNQKEGLYDELQSWARLKKKKNHARVLKLCSSYMFACRLRFDWARSSLNHSDTGKSNEPRRPRFQSKSGPALGSLTWFDGGDEEIRIRFGWWRRR